MEEAIQNNNWYEVGEILKQQIADNTYQIDLQQIQQHFYLIDPEILSVYYLNTPLEDQKRQQITHILKTTIGRSNVAADIFQVSIFYQEVLKNDFQSSQNLDVLAKTSSSTTAKFMALCALTHIALHENRYQEVFSQFKKLLQLYYQNHRSYYDFYIQKYINAVFAASLNCAVTDLFVFSFGQNFFNDQIKVLYQQLLSGTVIQQHQSIKVENIANNQQICVSDVQIIYHSRINALQMHLLSTPLHERASIDYNTIIDLLKLQKEIELEQIFTSLVLNGIVKARLDSIKKIISISYVQPVSGNKTIKNVLTQRIDEWMTRITACKNQFTEVLETGEEEQKI